MDTSFFIVAGAVLVLQASMFFLMIRAYNKLYRLTEEVHQVILEKNVLRKGIK